MTSRARSLRRLLAIGFAVLFGASAGAAEIGRIRQRVDRPVPLGLSDADDALDDRQGSLIALEQIDHR